MSLEYEAPEASIIAQESEYVLASLRDQHCLLLSMLEHTVPMSRSYAKLLYNFAIVACGGKATPKHLYTV